jgi:hypothetical protein
LALATRAGPPLLAPLVNWVITVTENKTHQKKKTKKNKKTKVRVVPGNCPDRQTNTPINLIYKIVDGFGWM